MKSEFSKDKTDFYAKTLAAATILLGALSFLRIAGFLAASSEVRQMAAKVDPNAQKAGTPADMGKLLASGKASAEELKKKNLFVKIPPRQNPVSEVLGILGDEALINGKWCKVGESVGDARIVAIEPTKVKIAWDGQEKDFTPIGSGGSGDQSQDRSGPSRSGGRGGAGNKAQVAAGNARGGPAPTGQGGPQLSAEERERMRSQWQNMSPEERQQARQQMRQRLGRRPQ
ncbi:MAG: hypothetical protein ABFE01_13630 [Phycisphaerales bacterium]